MKRISYFLVFLAICIHTPLSAQEKKSTTDNVTVTATGEGITKDDAKQNALRNAIELAFGTFVSSKIEVLNDDLIKDEIITVSNGNIQKFDVLSEVQMPDNSFAVTVNAIVSISKLTSFCESKGVTVEFKGSLFAMNVRLQEFNEKNEEKAIDNLCEIIKKISETSFKYYIWTKQPLKCGELWQVPIIVQVGMNENFNNIPDLMYNTIKGLSMNFDEVKNYNDLNKFVYPLSIGLPNNISGYFFLRNKTSV
ncbi:MAG: LPP20 family lipoprotein, partial [Bacteroidetes bacterium]|nr:LPP20 family lipoprotein [Bacteroidota bacterium]